MYLLPDYYTVEPSKPELLTTGNPWKLNDFVRTKFRSSYLNYPSKPKTPLNQT